MKRKTIAFMTVLALASSLSACEGKVPVSTDVTDTIRIEKTEAEIEKVQSALGKMPYYGDTANCKMSVEQATAFAQLIADGLAGDFSFRG